MIDTSFCISSEMIVAKNWSLAGGLGILMYESSSYLRGVTSAVVRSQV